MKKTLGIHPADHINPVPQLDDEFAVTDSSRQPPCVPRLLCAVPLGYHQAAFGLS